MSLRLPTRDQASNEVWSHGREDDSGKLKNEACREEKDCSVFVGWCMRQVFVF